MTMDYNGYLVDIHGCRVKNITWISSHIYSFHCDIITHPCQNFSGGLAKDEYPMDEYPTVLNGCN